MKLTSYRCDACGIEVDKPTYALTDYASGRPFGNDLHFCNHTCLLRYLTKQISGNQRQRLADLLEEWVKFGEALRREDREVFLQMLSEAEPLAQAFMSSGEGIPPNEALFMAVLLTIRSVKPIVRPEAGLDRLL